MAKLTLIGTYRVTIPLALNVVQGELAQVGRVWAKSMVCLEVLLSPTVDLHVRAIPFVLQKLSVVESVLFTCPTPTLAPLSIRRNVSAAPTPYYSSGTKRYPWSSCLSKAYCSK